MLPCLDNISSSASDVYIVAFKKAASTEREVSLPESNSRCQKSTVQVAHAGRQGRIYRRHSKEEEDANWHHLFTNPHEWFDKRKDKLQRSKSPDFVSVFGLKSPVREC